MEQEEFPTNELLLTALRARQTKAYEHVYRESLLSILCFVYLNNGKEYNARDLLQEAIIFLFRKLQNPAFSPPCEITTYTYSICRIIWYNKLQHDRLFWITRQIKEPEVNLQDVAEYLDIQDLVEDPDQKQQDEKFKSALNCLDHYCQKIFSKYYFYNQNLQEIAKAINYSSADAVKARKYRCMQKLKELFKGKTEADSNLEIIDQFLRKELPEEKFGFLQRRLREDFGFFQEVESQKRIIQKIQESEILKILDKTHEDISEKNKSVIQKYFEEKEARKRWDITPDPSAYDRIEAHRRFERRFLSESPAKMGFISIPYEGDLNPPFRIKVTSGKAQFEYLRVIRAFQDCSFHYGLTAEYGNVIELTLIGDFDPAKLTLVYHKQYNWWSLKLRIDAKEYNIDYSWTKRALE